MQDLSLSGAFPLVAAVLFLGLFAVLLFVMVLKGKLFTSKKQFEETTDTQRKTFLEEVAKKLYVWKTVHGSYPDGSTTEFQDFLKENNLTFIDPQDAQPTGHKDGQYFGYAYDNLHIDAKGNYEKNTQFFRLTCYFENLEDPDLNAFYQEQDPGRYMLLSSEYEDAHADEILSEEEVKVQQAMAKASGKPVEAESAPVIDLTTKPAASPALQSSTGSLSKPVVAKPAAVLRYPHFSPLVVFLIAALCLVFVVWNLTVFLDMHSALQDVDSLFSQTTAP